MTPYNEAFRLSSHFCHVDVDRQLKSNQVLTAVESLVPGYSCSAFLSPGGGGVTNITMSWGATFQRAHNTSRDSVARDIVTTKLGYWTDNAAYYDWYYAAYPYDLPSELFLR